MGNTIAAARSNWMEIGRDEVRKAHQNTEMIEAWAEQFTQDVESGCACFGDGMCGHCLLKSVRGKRNRRKLAYLIAAALVANPYAYEHEAADWADIVR